MSATKLVNYQHGMSRERFKQECALIVLDRLMEQMADKIQERFKGVAPTQLNKSLSQWEDTKARVVAGVVEAVADAVANALGPDVLPRGNE